MTSIRSLWGVTSPVKTRWSDTLLLLPLLVAGPGCRDNQVANTGLPSVEYASEVDPATCAGFNPHKNVYFGETHVHTAYSLDGFAFGSANLYPEDAISFAKGQPLPHPLGGESRLDRPLDFVVVTDHAEFFDLLGVCIADPANPSYDHPFCADLRADPLQGMTVITSLTFNIPASVPEKVADLDRGRQLVWRNIQNAAHHGHEPCAFSTFVGYEWTGGTISGDTDRGNLHRNVIFAGNDVPEYPADAKRRPHESALWAALESDCAAHPGKNCDAIVIPHNSNLSREGAMWDVENMEQAKSRAKYERLVEIYQHKGDSECDNQNLDPQDPGYDVFCNFEKITFSAIPDAGLGMNFTGDTDRRKSMVRHGLGLGVAYLEENGVNPLQMGIISSTDTHNATSGLVAEDSYRGNHGTFWEGSPSSRLNVANERSAGGLAAVWAEANTRKSIFAAFKRREAYGTSGPRIKLRFYAAETSSDYCADTAFPTEVQDARAIPMGGEYAAAASPVFVAWAEADAIPLERIQVVRLRAEQGSDYSETVTDVVVDAGGRNALCVHWQDPDFDSAQPAAYYVRVLEQPTKRWSTITCENHPGDCLDDTPEFIQERAWSSPIWVVP